MRLNIIDQSALLRVTVFTGSMVVIIVVIPVMFPDRSEVVLEGEATDLLALFQSASARRAKVEADPDARVADLFRCLREAVIRAHRSRSRGTGDAEVKMILVKEPVSAVQIAGLWH
jgi:hypothetical protein